MGILTRWIRNRRRQIADAERCHKCGMWLELEDRLEDEDGETVCESCLGDDEE